MQTSLLSSCVLLGGIYKESYWETVKKQQTCLGRQLKSPFGFAPSTPGRWARNPNVSFRCKGTRQVSSSLAYWDTQHQNHMHIHLCWPVCSGKFGIPHMLPRGLPSRVLAENSRMSTLNSGRLGTNSLKENKRLTEWKSSSSVGACIPQESLCEKCWVGSYWETQGSPGLLMPPIHQGFMAKLFCFPNGCVHIMS